MKVLELNNSGLCHAQGQNLYGERCVLGAADTLHRCRPLPNIQEHFGVTPASALVCLLPPLTPTEPRPTHNATWRHTRELGAGTQTPCAQQVMLRQRDVKVCMHLDILTRGQALYQGPLSPTGCSLFQTPITCDTLHIKSCC